MQKLIKHLLRRNDLKIALGITILIAYLSLGRAVDLGVDVPFRNIDKLKHCIAYFVLTYSWMFVLENKNALQKNKRKLLLFLFLYGALMEVLQMTLTSHRQGDFYDLIANSSGILICYFVFCKIHEKISVNL